MPAVSPNCDCCRVLCDRYGLHFLCLEAAPNVCRCHSLSVYASLTLACHTCARKHTHAHTHTHTHTRTHAYTLTHTHVCAHREDTFRAVFIRAPAVLQTGNAVEALAHYKLTETEKVGCRIGKVLMTPALRACTVLLRNFSGYL